MCKGGAGKRGGEVEGIRGGGDGGERRRVGEERRRGEEERYGGEEEGVRGV